MPASFEVEAVPAQDSQTPQVVREERVFDPRKARAPIKDRGQQNITVKAEGSPEVSKDAPAESVNLSPAAAAIGRKEQKLRQDQAALKAQTEAIEKDRAELTQLRELKAKIAAKDFSVIENDLPYSDYTDYLMAKLESEPSEEQQALKALEAKVDGVEKRLQAEATARDEALGAERKKAVHELVETNNSFAAIKTMGMQDAVLQHIFDTYQDDKVELTPEQAAKEVNELLLEKAARWASVIQPTQPAQVEPKNQLPPLKQATKTLSNDMAATGEIKRPNRSFAGMSDSERYAEARRRADLKLKK